MSGRSVPRWISAGLVLAAVAACGSTVTPGGDLSQGALGGPTGLGAADGGSAGRLDPDGMVQGSEPAAGAMAEGGRAGGSLTSPDAAADPAAAGGTSGGPGAGPDRGGAGAPGAESGRGYSKSTITIGIGSASDSAEYVAALGLGDLDSGDPKAQMKAVVDHINRSGGVAGRRIVTVHHEYDTAQVLNDPSAAHEAACATWTQDHQVFAVILLGSPTPSLLECLKRKDTPFLQVGGITNPRAYKDVYAKYPLYFNIGGMVYDLYDQLGVERLVARGFFEKWDTTRARPGTAPMKLGLLASEDPNGDTRLRSLRGQLARFGIKDSSVVRCPPTVNGVASCHQSAVLKFRSDGITHVIGGGLFFFRQADSQNYFPRYYIEGAAALVASTMAHRALVGSMSESFLPVYDVDAARDPGDPTPATGQCRQIMKKAGLDTSERLAMGQMASYCDGFFFLRAAVGKAPALTAAGLRVGLESLGSTVPSAITFATRLGPGSHASTFGLRDLKFVPETCSGCGDGYYAYASSTTYTAK